PAHRPDLVEAPAERHGARSRDAPEAQAQTRGPAADRGGDDRAEGLGADGKTDEARRRRRARARAGATRSFLDIPRVAGAPFIPDVAIGERAERRLGDEHRTGLSELLHPGRTALGEAPPIGLGPPAGRDARRVEKVLGAPGDAMQRAEINAFREKPVGAPRLLARKLRRRHGDAFELFA